MNECLDREYYSLFALSVPFCCSDLTEQCAMYAMPTLCYSALPICKSKQPPIPDLICRQVRKNISLCYNHGTNTYRKKVRLYDFT